MPLADWIDKYPYVKALLETADENLIDATDDDPSIPSYDEVMEAQTAEASIDVHVTMDTDLTECWAEEEQVMLGVRREDTNGHPSIVYACRVERLDQDADA